MLKKLIAYLTTLTILGVSSPVLAKKLEVVDVPGRPGHKVPKYVPEEDRVKFDDVLLDSERLSLILASDYITKHCGPYKDGLEISGSRYDLKFRILILIDGATCELKDGKVKVTVTVPPPKPTMSTSTKVLIVAGVFVLGFVTGGVAGIKAAVLLGL